MSSLSLVAYKHRTPALLHLDQPRSCAVPGRPFVRPDFFQSEIENRLRATGAGCMFYNEKDLIEKNRRHFGARHLGRQTLLDQRQLEEVTSYITQLQLIDVAIQEV